MAETICPACLIQRSDVWTPSSGRKLCTVTCPDCGHRGLYLWSFLRLYRHCPEPFRQQQAASTATTSRKGRWEAPAAAWCYGFEEGYLTNPQRRWPWRDEAPTAREQAAHAAGKALGAQRRLAALEFVHRHRPVEAQWRAIATGRPITPPTPHPPHRRRGLLVRERRPRYWLARGRCGVVLALPHQERRGSQSSRPR
jgi:hypothetical protein